LEKILKMEKCVEDTLNLVNIVLFSLLETLPKESLKDLPEGLARLHAGLLKQFEGDLAAIRKEFPVIQEKAKEESQTAKEGKKPEKGAQPEKGGAPKENQMLGKPDPAPQPAAAAKKKDKKEAIDPAYVEMVNSLKITRRNKGQKVLPDPKKRNILITSALPYVNNTPHLGTLIGCVLSGDVFSRYCRLRGYNAVYFCGTDEYGTATETKALQEKKTPMEVCDHYFKIHDAVYKWFDCDFDYFGRTTTEKQTQIAQDIFMRLHNNQNLVTDTVTQLYCKACSRFLADRYVAGMCPSCGYLDAKGDQCDGCGKLHDAVDLVNPKCTVCNSQPEIRSSEHLFLDLPKLTTPLQEWIDKSSVEGKWTANSVNTTYAWLKAGLTPRCVTRDLKWGTPVPLEKYKDKVFYVWFDAPIGYISITANFMEEWKQWWQNPEQIQLYQFMGKDNITFHTIIFPATLIGTGLNWTKLHHISTTEYIMYEGTKFSKSRGIGVFGDDAVNSGVPVDMWRYYLLRLRPETSDSDFRWEDFGAKINGELADNLGNLILRVLSFCYKNKSQKIPDGSLEKMTGSDNDFFKALYSHFEKYCEDFEKVAIRDCLSHALKISAECNKFMQENQVWSKDANPERYPPPFPSTYLFYLAPIWS
jgi:methionyl-tRNA synthetase